MNWDLVLIFLFRSCFLLPHRASPLVVALLVGGGQLLAAVLADVAAMAGPALLAIYLEAQFHSRLPALLSGGASVSEGIGEPLELSLVLALTSLPMNSRLMARVEPKLASAAHEDTGVELSMAPLVLARLLSRVPLPLPDLAQTSESEWKCNVSDTYIRLTSSFRSFLISSSN